MANAIFTQNVSACIYKGCPSHLCPFNVDFVLPSDENSWHARSAKECLGHLKSNPRPIRFSVALKKLQQWPIQPGLEMSASGMFTAIHALHFMLWIAVRSDSEEPQSSSQVATPANGHTAEVQNLAADLLANFDGPHILSLSNNAVSRSGNSTLIRISRILDNWLQVWSARRSKEAENEIGAFCIDPLPFLWLAKLFLLLHCRSSEVSGHEEFAAVLRQGTEVKVQMRFQAQIYKWMSRLRHRKNTGSVDEDGGVRLPEIMRPITTT